VRATRAGSWLYSFRLEPDRRPPRLADWGCGPCHHLL